MRKFTCFTLGLLLACAVTVNAQEQKNDQEGYKFTDIKRLPTTSVEIAGSCRNLLVLVDYFFFGI